MLFKKKKLFTITKYAGPIICVAPIIKCINFNVKKKSLSPDCKEIDKR